jgi:hypothetical protein
MCKRLFHLITCVLVLGFASGVASGSVRVLLDFEGADTLTVNMDNTVVTETSDAPEGSTTSATWAIPSPVGGGEMVRHGAAPMDFSDYNHLNFYMKVSADPGNTGSWLSLEKERDVSMAGVWTQPISDLSPNFTVGEWFYVSIPFTTLAEIEGGFPADFSEVGGVVLYLESEGASFDVSVDYFTVSTTPEEGMLAQGPPEEDPPTPNPATFAIAPAADSDTAISMTATEGEDATDPVEYLFTCTAGGGNSSS